MSGTPEILQHATLEELRKIRAGKVVQLKPFGQQYLEAKERAEYYEGMKEHAAGVIILLETEITIIDRMIAEKRKADKPKRLKPEEGKTK